LCIFDKLVRGRRDDGIFERQTAEEMKKKINIHIGGLYASRRPAVIETVLGSCVAVCLHDRVARIGGMNHILLPGRADLKRFDNVARYAINAMEMLINRLMNLGGERPYFTAKVFGGAHILPAISSEHWVGAKNSEFVLEFLKTEAIVVVSQDLGGHDTRKIYFHTDTGEVFLKRIPFNSWPKISREENLVLDALRKKIEEPADVTLFD
jgi:chemotaxis protein CheD